jgi:hypothetical protein
MLSLPSFLQFRNKQRCEEERKGCGKLQKRARFQGLKDRKEETRYRWGRDG